MSYLIALNCCQQGGHPGSENGFTLFSNKMAVGPSDVEQVEIVSEKSIGDPAATADQVTGVAGHVKN